MTNEVKTVCRQIPEEQKGEGCEPKIEKGDTVCLKSNHNRQMSVSGFVNDDVAYCCYWDKNGGGVVEQIPLCDLHVVEPREEERDNELRERKKEILAHFRIEMEARDLFERHYHKYGMDGVRYLVNTLLQLIVRYNENQAIKSDSENHQSSIT